MGDVKKKKRFKKSSSLNHHPLPEVFSVSFFLPAPVLFLFSRLIIQLCPRSEELSEGEFVFQSGGRPSPHQCSSRSELLPQRHEPRCQPTWLMFRRYDQVLTLPVGVFSRRAEFRRFYYVNDKIILYNTNGISKRIRRYERSQESQAFETFSPKEPVDRLSSEEEKKT